MSIPELDLAHWVDRSVLCWLATADAEGKPNVSPKEMMLPDGNNRLVIAHIASPQTVANLAVNNRVCVVLLDVLSQLGWQLHGQGEVLEPAAPGFDQYQQKLAARYGSQFPIQSIIVITIHAEKQVLAPSYWLFPEQTTEEGQRQQALRRYGIRPEP